ncbi:response regulator transcription factor [Streptomyces sp. QL37]|uniref:response regulator transcription factor n=1 Tax=Streptomyces sp. QL37 TaxID=2093747 RepID=UPI000CF2CE40|nr:response regulator transcription factor [Streptomyces sp. QL37]PPQ57500.1 DNA-binding response regulator [Streptomyces sp. QL37]
MSHDLDLLCRAHPAPQPPPRTPRPPLGRRDLTAVESWTILVVCGDTRAAQSLADELSWHGHTVRPVTTGAAALEEHHSVDLILLDLALPDVDGLQVCRTIAAQSDIPILAVTGRSTELDRVLGLQAGADDYVTEPYGVRELLARMAAVMRRARPRPRTAPRTRVGPLVIERETREVRLHGCLVPLTRKEFDLLQLLASQPGTIFPRRQLLQQIWHDTDVTRSRTIDTHVNSLRRKLGSSQWVLTVRGVGFSLSERLAPSSVAMRCP